MGEEEDKDGKAPFPLPGLSHAVLPESYYDLVARILPGAFFVIGLIRLLHVLPHPKMSLREALHLSGAGMTLLLVCSIWVAYTAGILLTGLQHRLRGIYLPCVWSAILSRYQETIDERRVELGLREGWALDVTMPPLVWWRPSGWLMCFAQCRAVSQRLETIAASVLEPLHDLLKERSVQARFILPKMNAEASLCDNLAAAALVLSLVSLAGSHLPWLTPLLGAHDDRKALLLALSAIPLLITGRHRYDRYVKRHFAYWNNVPPPNAGRAKKS